MITRRRITTALFIIFSFSASAQYVEEKEDIKRIGFYRPDQLRLTLGMASPQGSYREQDINNFQSAEAGNGFASSLEYIKPWKSIDFLGRVSYISNPVVSDYLLHQLSTSYPMANFNITTGYFQMLSAQGGLSFQYALENGTLYAKALFGYARLFVPRMEIVYTDAKISETLNWKKSSANSYVYTMGIGASRDAGRLFVLYLDIELSSAQFIYRSEVSSSLGGSTSKEVRKTVTNFIPSLGIGLKLGI